MDAVEALLTRTTVPPAKMGPPGPDELELACILEAGAAAPDHGRLTPFRFLVVRGADRERLGELFAAAVEAKPDASQGEAQKQREAPLRAPLIVIAVARVDRDHPKIPAVEQIASAACAVQNVLVAAHATGFAGKWATGKNAYDPVIRNGLGLAPDEHVMGFLYLGSRAVEQAPGPRPALEALVRSWPGERA